MPVDYDDLETDSADVEKKVIEGESSVDLDYKSNMTLAEHFFKKSVKEEKMLPNKSEEELEFLFSKINLTEHDKYSSISENAEDPDEIISRAPVGGIPVTFADNYSGMKALKNGLAFDANFGNSYPIDGKSKRSYTDSKFQAVKYKKPTESSDSLLQMQCSTMPEFLNQNVITYMHQTSGGMVTIKPSPSTVLNEEYDSSFSPGESIDSSLPGDVQVVSPFSDYSSMASPENFNEECVSGLDESKLNDIYEVIKEDLNSSRIKEEKERLEKELCDDRYVASSPLQYVPGQGTILSSSPPSLCNPDYNGILGDFLNELPSQQNPASNQQQVFSRQQVFSQQQQQPPITTCTQLCQPSLVNSNHQFTQQQQQQPPPLMTSPSNLQYNVQTQQTNGLNKTPTHQNYPAEQITSGNQPQYGVPKPQVNSQVPQPVTSSSLLGYTQQDQLSAAQTVSNQHLISQQQTQMTQNSNQFPVTLNSISSNQQPFSQAQEVQFTTPSQYAVKQQSQIITTTSGQPQYTTSPPQPHVTATQGHVTGCAIQSTQQAIPQLTLVMPKQPGNTSVVTPNNSGLSPSSPPDQNGVTAPATPAPAASPNNAVIIFTQPTNSQNPIMLVPSTNPQLLYVSQIPVTPKNKIRPERKILPKPANADPNGNLVNQKKLPTQAGKGRRDKDKSSQQSETYGPGKLGMARRCVAEVKDSHFESISNEGDNYLHIAVCETDVYLIEALLERLHRSGKLDLIDGQNHARQTPVYLAVSANKPAMVHKLIRYGADVNIKGMTRGYERVERAPIHCAAACGKEYYDTLKELLKSEKIDLDILNSDGLSALHCAIIEHGKLVHNQKMLMTKVDNCQNVSLLLKHKANPNLPDRCSGKTPLMYALESKDYAMVETILKGVESSKIPELLTTQTFDGRNCKKIVDGLRNEYDPQTWKKLHGFLLHVQ